MALHFSGAEYAARRAALGSALADRGLDGLLCFAQESMYWLTGYDTFGFCFFQCLYLGKDGKLALLTRLPDLRQAQHTSILDDIRVWTDEGGARPENQLRDMLESVGARGKRLGIEYHSYGLTAANGKAGIVHALPAVNSDAIADCHSGFDSKHITAKEAKEAKEALQGAGGHHETSSDKAPRPALQAEGRTWVGAGWWEAPPPLTLNTGTVHRVKDGRQAGR